MYNQMYQQPVCSEGMQMPAPAWQSQGNQNYPTPPMAQMMPMMATPPVSQPGVMGAQMDQLPVEQSYIENILRLNRGKEATVYMTFEGEDGGNRQQVFKGIIEAAGRDHIILSDPQTGMRYLLLMVYLNYVTFDEEVEYKPRFEMATYSPR